MVQRSIKIQREISRIENVYPNDNLIVTYKDFLKYRDFLHLYQYNSEVFCSLIDITYNLWYSGKRISRRSLLQVTKRYLMKSKTRDDIPPKTATQIFELFKQIIVHENFKLNIKTVEVLKNTINSILIGIKLSDIQLKWLCTNASKSQYILNRILRYNYKSIIISNWAQNNYENDFVRARRSEITSWVIDKNPAFVIDKKTLITDFEFQNESDKQSWGDYNDNLRAYYLIVKDLSPIFIPNIHTYDEAKRMILTENNFSLPHYNQARRVYKVYEIFDGFFENGVPDFEKTEKLFYSEFDNYYNRTMAWSIAYSRISIKEKIKYIFTYYSDNVYPTYFNIGVSLKNVEYFSWLELISND